MAREAMLSITTLLRDAACFARGSAPSRTNCRFNMSAFSLARSCSLASLPAPVNRSPQSPPSSATTAVLSMSLYGLLEAVIMLLVARSEAGYTV